MMLELLATVRVTFRVMPALRRTRLELRPAEFALVHFLGLTVAALHESPQLVSRGIRKKLGALSSFLRKGQFWGVWLLQRFGPLD